MALQSEVSPPIVGESNKDTQIEGDTKSDEEDSASSTDDEDIDLEEGEILDSGAEEESQKDFTNSSLKDALDQSCLQSIEKLVNSAKNAAENAEAPSQITNTSPHKVNHRSSKYRDQDHASDEDDGWRPSSPKYRRKFDDKPIDYRQELAAYRGTPPSSPERKKRDEKSKIRKKSSKKSKRKTIKRKDIKGHRVQYKEHTRTKTCKFFKEGKCSKGSDCAFSHANPLAFKKKKELCKFYLNGHCNKGRDCIYMHGDFPCKFFHTGSECYAKNDCRFSHVPLTAEMRKVLDDYLRMTHGDRDDHLRHKRHRSRSPEPPRPPQRAVSPSKRTCLLGSPPRHIREAEETRRWQEEMKAQQHPSFQIRLSPSGEEAPQFQKPNFYQETLPGSPNPQKEDDAKYNEDYTEYNKDESSKVYVYDEDEYAQMTVPPVVKTEVEDDFDWQNDQHLQVAHHQPYKTIPTQEPDFSSDVKFDETTQFSEMDSSMEPPTLASPNLSPSQGNFEEPEPAFKQEDRSLEEVTPAPTIVVPAHLPRKQRELFLRVQQHLKTNTAAERSPTEAMDDPPQDEPIVKEEILDKEVHTNDDKWYSSEEDEDEYCNKPITEVLKKIQQEPPKLVAEAQKPAMNLMQMLQKLQQSSIEKQKSNPQSIQPQKPDNYLTNLIGVISGTPVPPVLPTPPLNLPDLSRRTLLPDPVPKDPPAAPIDPRLKTRDPRVKSSAPASASPDQSQITTNLPLKPVVSIEKPAETVPYRLHGIIARAPNYTPYILSSPTNPNLLKDPRLRRHLKTSDEDCSDGKTQEVIKPSKEIPPIPELLLKYNKNEVINIFEISAKKVEETPKQDTPAYVPIISTPTIKPAVDYSADSSLPSMEDRKADLTPPHPNPLADYTADAPLSRPKSFLSEPQPAASYVPITKPTYSLPNRDITLESSSSHTPASEATYNMSDSDLSPDEKLSIVEDEKPCAFEIDFAPIVKSPSNNLVSEIKPTPKPIVTKPLPEKISNSKPHIPVAVAAQKIIDVRRRKRSSRSNSGSGNSGSDTPPHLTIAEGSGFSPAHSEFQNAPVLESATGESVLIKINDSLTSKKDTPKVMTSKQKPIKKETIKVSDDLEISAKKKTGNSDIHAKPAKRKIANETNKDIKSVKKDTINDSHNVTSPAKIVHTNASKNQVKPIKNQNSSVPTKRAKLEKNKVVKDLDSQMKLVKNEIANNLDVPVKPTKKEFENTSSKKTKPTKKKITNYSEGRVKNVKSEISKESENLLKPGKSEIANNCDSQEISKEINSDDDNTDIDESALENIDNNMVKNQAESAAKVFEIRSPSPEKEALSKSAKTAKQLNKIVPSPKKEIIHKADAKLSRRKSTSPDRQVIFMAEMKQAPDGNTDSDKPPVVPPIIIKKVKPIPASHLPKAIADPRMAKLHTPRSRLAPDNGKKNSKSDISETMTDVTQNDEKTIRSTPRKRRLSDVAKSPEKPSDDQPRKTRSSSRRRLSDAGPSPYCELSDSEEEQDRPKRQRTSPKKRRSLDSQKTNTDEPVSVSEEKPPKAKSIPKKRRLSDKSEKKKTVHRNRKSSMEYASPLHSHNDSDSSRSLDYNNYNQRQKKPAGQSQTTMENTNTDYLLSDSSTSLDCDNNSDVNLKDRFKTIDPTASPFC